MTITNEYETIDQIIGHLPTRRFLQTELDTPSYINIKGDSLPSVTVYVHRLIINKPLYIAVAKLIGIDDIFFFTGSSFLIIRLDSSHGLCVYRKEFEESLPATIKVISTIKTLT